MVSEIKNNIRPQSDLFAAPQIDLGLPNAEVSYFADFLQPAVASDLFAIFKDSMPWQQDELKIFGKKVLAPRLTVWVGEEWMTYSYSNHTLIPKPWTPELLRLKEQVQNHTQQTFNSVLLNYYRDGRDSNGWHSDDEPELGDKPVIASVSLGGARDFQLRHKHGLQENTAIELEHGSLLLMQGDTQSYWQHQIPKRAQAEARINLTFRTIVAHQSL